MASAKQLCIQRLLTEEPPRSDELAQQLGRRLFPLWQAVLVGAPAAVVLGAIVGVLCSLGVALAVNALLGPPRPAWLGSLSEIVLFATGLTVFVAVGMSLRARRRRFVSLARHGQVLLAHDVEATGLGKALGSTVGRAAAKVAMGGGLGGTVALMYGGPIVGAEVDGQSIAVRVPADSKGRFPQPTHVLAAADNRFAALLYGGNDIKPQRVRRPHRK